MSLIQLNNLNKYYGATPILRNIDLTIGAGEKWGLVGRNGCGKTTLMKILTREEDFDGGELHFAQNCHIGYLQQEPVFKEDSTIYEELRSIFKDLDALQAQISELQRKMSESDLASSRLAALIEDHHLLSEQFEQQGGYQVEGRIQGVLRGLGFSKERWTDQVMVLSGGERTRLAMAKILLTANDILFLDEPTNYLDISAIEWLEKFLIGFSGAVLLISHDRYFLDHVVNGIYEIEFCNLKRYRGNYTFYRRQKELDMQAALKSFEQQEKELSRLDKFIRESRATEKSKRKAHSIEKRLSKVERIEKPIADDRSLKLNFKEPVASSRQVLELEDVSKGYDGKSLFKGVCLRIEAGEKIGLIGPNGAGKTTLLRIIQGLEQPDNGRVRMGYEVYPSCFSQLTAGEELSGTPFSQIMEAADLNNTEARTILGRFLFSGDDVFKSMADLSGGERRRLGLVKLMLSKANFLILDEPTNHLDLDSIEIIEKALLDYSGTVLIVSHDRSFLYGVVDRYVALVNNSLLSFSSYQDYLEFGEKIDAMNSKESIKPKSVAQVYRERNKEAQRDLKRKQRNLNQIENDIENMEQRKKELLLLLNDFEIQTDYKKSMEYGQELTEVESKLAQLYELWEQLQEQLTIDS
jgi:ATP-binding cassette subfamily F protein 3